MVIEFLFSEIMDKSKLYDEGLIKVNNRFINQTESVPYSNYIGKTYCTDSMEIVKSKVPGIKKCEYKGALERLANEVFELETDHAIYVVSCTIDTYPSAKTRMLVRIMVKPLESDDSKHSTTSLIDSYDQILERVKLQVKDAFRSDWKSCVWIKDEQSEVLCSNLYPYIFRAENRLRAFANKLLIWELGSDWLDSPGLEKYFESHKKLSEDFRNREPAFSDVDDVFISTTLETLFEIIQKGVVYESPFQLSQKQFNDFLNVITKADKKENISKWLIKHRCEKKVLWKDIFEPYFAATDNSQQIITDFIKNRNHIAHNKPITLSAYTTMAKSFTDLDAMVKDANQKFEESVPSEELYLTIDIENEQAREVEEQKEYERNYLRDRIYGETGVEILWHDDIFEMFIEKANLLYQTFHDLFYWDSRFDFSTMHAIEDNETWQTLFSVECKANEEYYLEVQVEIVVDDEMDGDSSLNYRYIIHGVNGEIIHSNDGRATASVRYHNGSGSENVFEGTVDLLSSSDIDESEIDDFLDELKSAIETFNPYIAIKEAMEMAAAKDGEPQPVADFPCWECEQYGVSLREDLYKYGHCCYCGSDNEVKECEKCGEPFGDGGGTLGLCNSCIALIEKE